MQIFSIQSDSLEIKMPFVVNIICSVVVFLPKCCKFALFMRLRALCMRVSTKLKFKKQ